MAMSAGVKVLADRVCLVTGASRGIGKGIALQLGEAGGIVYITGRSRGPLEAAGQEIETRGGQAIPIVMDHSIDEEVEKLFQRIQSEQKGKLDLVVNNAYAGVGTIMESMGKKFWETDARETWDTINHVGLRNHYLCTVYASRLMVPRKSGLIVNVSSPGGLVYLFNVAYGVGKAACDRMAADCGTELKKHNVTMISLWPGAVETELIKTHILDNEVASEKQKSSWKDAESVEFAGKAIVHLAADANVHKKTAKIILTSDCAREYGFQDLDGKIHSDIRLVKTQLHTAGWVTLASFVPEFVRIPSVLMHMVSNKF